VVHAVSRIRVVLIPVERTTSGSRAAGALHDLLVLDVGLDASPPGFTASGIGQEVREHLVVVLRVHQLAQNQLLDVREATRLARLLARAGEDREEDRRQDGNDGDHNQQLNERETTVLHLAPPLVVGFRLLGGYKIAVKE